TMEGISTQNEKTKKVTKKYQKSLFKYFGNSAAIDTTNTITHTTSTGMNQSTKILDGNIIVGICSAQYQPNETSDDTTLYLEDKPIGMPELEDILVE
ncbi:hypothetical protein KI387_041212, partial [Taxus chinensis]